MESFLIWEVKVKKSFLGKCLVKQLSICYSTHNEQNKPHCLIGNQLSMQLFIRLNVIVHSIFCGIFLPTQCMYKTQLSCLSCLQCSLQGKELFSPTSVPFLLHRKEKAFMMLISINRNKSADATCDLKWGNNKYLHWEPYLHSKDL